MSKQIAAAYKFCHLKVLQEVAIRKQAAEKIQQQVQKVKDKALAIVNEIATDKALAEEKLEAAKPALEV